MYKRLLRRSGEKICPKATAAALEEAATAFVNTLLRDCNLQRQHAGRMTIQVQDVAAACARRWKPLYIEVPSVTTASTSRTKRAATSGPPPSTPALTPETLAIFEAALAAADAEPGAADSTPTALDPAGAVTAVTAARSNADDDAQSVASISSAASVAELVPLVRVCRRKGLHDADDLQRHLDGVAAWIRDGGMGHDLPTVYDVTPNVLAASMEEPQPTLALAKQAAPLGPSGMYFVAAGNLAALEETCVTPAYRKTVCLHTTNGQRALCGIGYVLMLDSEWNLALRSVEGAIVNRTRGFVVGALCIEWDSDPCAPPAV